MKLKTNLFQGKKPSLEEGQMIYQIEKDDTIVNHVEGNNNCRRCMQLMKVIFYVALVLFVLFVGWIGLVFLAQDLASEKSRGICGTPFLPDYEEWMKDGIQDSSALNPNTVSEEDIVLRSLGVINEFMEAETSTISSLSEADEFDVEMIPSASRSVELSPNDKIQNFNVISFLRNSD